MPIENAEMDKSAARPESSDSYGGAQSLAILKADFVKFPTRRGCRPTCYRAQTTAKTTSAPAQALVASPEGWERCPRQRFHSFRRRRASRFHR